MWWREGRLLCVCISDSPTVSHCLNSEDEDAGKVRALHAQTAEVTERCDTREAHMQTVIKEMVR